MQSILMTAMAVVAVVVALGTAIQLWYCSIAPRSAYRLQQNNGPKWFHATVVIALIGAAICIYNGIDAVLFWLPEHWGFLDSDDQWTSWRSQIAGWGAVFGAAGVGTVWGNYIPRIGRHAFEAAVALNFEDVTKALARNDESYTEYLIGKYEKKIEVLKAGWKVGYHDPRPVDFAEVEAYEMLLEPLRDRLKRSDATRAS